MIVPHGLNKEVVRQAVDPRRTWELTAAAAGSSAVSVIVVQWPNSRFPNSTERSRPSRGIYTRSAV